MRYLKLMPDLCMARLSASRRQPLVCGLLAASLFSSASAFAGPQLPDPLQTGRVQFETALGEPLTALAINPEPDSPKERLLRAKALADLGLYDQARASLEPLAGAGDQIAVESGLELVRLASRTGETDQAQEYLDEILPHLVGNELQEALFHQAELMRQEGRLAAAADVLGRMGTSPWTSAGYFNLAAAYSALDDSVSRPLVALRVAVATVGADDRDVTNTGAELVDRSHLAGGLLALNEGDHDKALGFLSKVRLDSYQAPRALYLHGLAHFKQNNVRAALQSWHRARKFPLAFPGTPESYIATGQGFEEAGASAQAADAFLTAKAAFEKERVILKELSQSIAREGGYQALVQASRQHEVEWFLDNSQAVTAPRVAWLMRYMEEPKAQRALKNLFELAALDQRLALKQADLEVIGRSLRSRLDAVRGGEDDRLDALEQQISTLRKRADDLRSRYAAAVAGNKIRELVSGNLAERFDRLEALESAAEHHADAELLERVRRLRGLTLWQAQDIVERDRIGVESTLDGLQAQIDQAEATLTRFSEKSAAAPGKFREFLDRVSAASERIEDQRQRIAALQSRSDQLLTSQLQTFIQNQQEQLELLEDRSEQEVAHLYEYMALDRLQAAKPAKAAP